MEFQIKNLKKNVNKHNLNNVEDIYKKSNIYKINLNRLIKLINY